MPTVTARYEWNHIDDVVANYSICMQGLSIPFSCVVNSYFTKFADYNDTLTINFEKIEGADFDGITASAFAEILSVKDSYINTSSGRRIETHEVVVKIGSSGVGVYCNYKDSHYLRVERTGNVDGKVYGENNTLISYNTPILISSTKNEYLLTGVGATNTIVVKQWYYTNEQSGESENSVDMSGGDKTVEVEFINTSVQSYTLTTNILGSGNLSTYPLGPEHPQGTVVDLTAYPTNQDWFVKSWYGTDYDSSTELTNKITIPDHDVTVTVEFSHVPFYLTLEVATGLTTGTLSPSSGFYDANSVVQLEASPATGYQVQKWEGTGDHDIFTSTNNSVLMDADKTVKVYFEPSTVINYTLTTSVIGGHGFITPSPTIPPEEWEKGITVTLLAGAEDGYRVAEWTGTDYDDRISETNYVTMTSNKEVTVRFEVDPDYIEDPDSDLDPAVPDAQGWIISPYTYDNIFLCPSDEVLGNVIRFTYYNDTGEEKTVDFHMKFYADIGRKTLLYTAFTVANTKRWFIEGTTTTVFTNGGTTVSNEQTVDIMFVPEILPHEKVEEQRNYLANTVAEENIYELPLLCGVKYYVDIGYKFENSNYIYPIKTIVFQTSGEVIDGSFDRQNNDKKTWICSGQGNDDIRVTNSMGQSTLSSLDANLFGHFMVAWEDTRHGYSKIYGAIYDSDSEVFYSSGQGYFDSVKINQGQHPKILVDQAQNFYISSLTRDQIYVNKCSMPISCLQEPPVIYDSEQLCFPGADSFLDIGDDIRIRIYQEDAKGNIVISESEVLTVVTDSHIRFDITGVAGSYAVRLRSSSNKNWSDWINIGVGIYTGVNSQGQSNPKTVDDSSYDAYFIGNNRFIVPWDIGRENGIRRVCGQILTVYGITKTFCIEFLSNFDELDYSVEFYKDSGFSNQFSFYNGMPVLSAVLGNTIYIKIKFNTNEDMGILTFNVVQQGINDRFGEQDGLILTKSTIEEGVYTGSFEITKSDGIFNKDGKGILTINIPGFPTNLEATYCEDDIRMASGNYLDYYNLNGTFVNHERIRKMNDANAEEVFSAHRTTQFNRVTDINSLKRLYNSDDPQYMFGDPSFYKDNE